MVTGFTEAEAKKVSTVVLGCLNFVVIFISSDPLIDLIRTLSSRLVLA